MTPDRAWLVFATILAVVAWLWWTHRQHPADYGPEQAKRKADSLKGYVRQGWTMVYPSPAYLKAHPMGGGGGAVGGMERVNPPASLWTDQGRPDWVAP